MDLFETGRTRAGRKLRGLLPVIVLAVLCLIFYLGISYAGRETISREQTSLRQALEQGAIHTYSLTGHYPQSLDELLRDYHISYDTDKFVVEYVPNGSNLLPSVSVMVLSSGKGGIS